jgi:hypothetical protein
MQIVDKYAWLTSVAAGRTVADVGGLWGLTNEMVGPALQAGATHATMIDIQPSGNQLWADFKARMAQLGLDAYACIEADAAKDDFPEHVGRYDVVHCSGIIYHLPDPFSLILRLRQITREYFILTSMYVPEIIENDAGRVDLSGGAALLLHALEGHTRVVLTRHFELNGLQIAGATIPLTEPLLLPDGRGNTSPWWWLMPPSLLSRMLEIAGFEVLERGDSWEGRSASFFCRVRAEKHA